MIFPDSKKAAGVILSKMGGDKMTEMKPEEEMDDKSEGLRASAEDILMAIDSKSSSDLMTALKSFYDQMESQEAPEPEAE